MNLSENFKKFMGMVEEKVADIGSTAHKEYNLTPEQKAAAAKDAIQPSSLSDVVPEFVTHATGSELAGLAASFVSPTSAVKSGAKMVGSRWPKRDVLTDEERKLFTDEVAPLLDDVMNPKSRSTIVRMTPEEYLKMAYPRERTYSNLTKEQIQSLGEQKRVPIREALGGSGLNEMPKLEVSKGKVIGHEGRHRMDVFKELGHKKIPVEIRDTMHRWGENPPTYTELISETGEQTIKMPKSLVWE